MERKSLSIEDQQVQGDFFILERAFSLDSAPLAHALTNRVFASLNARDAFSLLPHTLLFASLKSQDNRRYDTASASQNSARYADGLRCTSG